MTPTNKIDDLISIELEEANKIHPPFHSPHEGYAVLLEEVEEAKDEFEEIYCGLDELWWEIKQDNICKSSIWKIKNNTLKAIQELIQVAAMCDKFSDAEGSLFKSTSL